MSHTAKRTLNKRIGGTIVIVCGECGRSTTHEILTDVASYENYGGDIKVWESYLIVQCRGCLTLSFCKESECSEDWDPQNDNALLVQRHLFPGRVAGRPPLRDAHHLPWELLKIYEEARSALMEGLPVLTGIGIRAIVETV